MGLSITAVFSQTDSTAVKDEKVKTGFSMGGVPALAYNTDTGFRYGALANLYFYGDGSNYPAYNHSIYMEWSRTTKGSGNMHLEYDARTLIPNTRMKAEVRYLTEQALDFYGFNGYESYYNSDFSNDSHDDYITRMFYRHERKMLRLKADFEGNIGSEKLRWLAGFSYNNVEISSVDIATLNDGQEPENMLPDTATLYDNYVDWGIIKEDQVTGGNVTSLKLGAVYDTRDNEPNPNRGIWSEAILTTAPSFLGNDYAYSKLLLTHRQYFTIVPERLTFAYRLSWQARLGGEIPFYMLPFAVDSKRTEDGLGGAKNVRGVYRNRIQGNSMAFGNFEFRWKFYKGVVLNQNLYLALNTFIDAGMVTEKYSFEPTVVLPAEYSDWIDYEDETLHPSFGGGLRIALNENFIIAVEYGQAFAVEKDGSGFYIGLNYLF